MTRRFVALLIALLLPLQLAWGMAAAYCQHETAPHLSKHLGHHEHVHQGDANKGIGGKLVADSDCGTCNAATTALIPDGNILARAGWAARALDAAPCVAYPSALARPPDRPQWLRLA